MEGFFLGKKSSGRRTSRSVPAKRRNTAPNGSGRKYELIGLILLAFALLSGIGILGLNVGFVGFFFADFFREWARSGRGCRRVQRLRRWLRPVSNGAGGLFAMPGFAA